MPNPFGVVFTSADTTPTLLPQDKINILSWLLGIADALGSSGGLPQGADVDVATRLARIEATLGKTGFRNVQARNNVTTPAAKVDVTWDVMAIGGVLVENFTGTCDLSVPNAVDGRDSSAALATGWYHLHAIYNPTTLTTKLLFSSSPTNPTLPVGYTLSRFIGQWAQTGTTAALKQQVQINDEMFTPASDVGPDWRPVNNVAAESTTWTTPTVTTYLPPNTRCALLRGILSLSSVAMSLSFRTKGMTGNGVTIVEGPASGGVRHGASLWLPLNVSQQFEWITSAEGAGTVYVDVLGWKVPL
jgi:hypothetical protein